MSKKTFLWKACPLSTGLKNLGDVVGTEVVDADHFNSPCMGYKWEGSYESS